jgi:hypothetical protein
VTIPFAMVTSTFVAPGLDDGVAEAKELPDVAPTGVDPDPPEPLSSPDPQPAITKTASAAATTETERGTRISRSFLIGGPRLRVLDPNPRACRSRDKTGPGDFRAGAVPLVLLSYRLLVAIVGSRISVG